MMRAKIHRYRPVILVAAILLIITGIGSAITGLIVKSSISDSNRQQAAQSARKLRQAQVSGCGRQNIRQLSFNKNALATWKYDKLFASAVHDGDRRSKRGRLVLAFRARLRDTIETLTWTPLVRDCQKTPTATELPVSFVQAKPARFDLGLRPKH